MDASGSRDRDGKVKLQKDIAQDVDGIASYVWPLHYPLKLFVDLISAGLRLMRPFAPQLIPLSIFLLTLPVLAFFSFSAGWIVWKSVAVGWETDVFLQYGDGIPPYAKVAIPNVVERQPYDISLHLVVPTSESNVALGNFMTTLTMLSFENKTLATVRRSAMVLPPSSAPWSLLYNKPGTTDLMVPLLSAFATGTNRVLAHVELGRHDMWKTIGKGEGRELSVLSALLRGVVVHKGVRGLITRFPLLSAFAASSVFMSISFAILATCVIPAVQWRVHRDAPGDPQRPVNSESGDEKPPTRRQRGPRRSRSAAVRAPAEPKLEETTTIIPPAASETSTPLRRRRSRSSQHSVPDT